MPDEAISGDELVDGEEELVSAEEVEEEELVSADEVEEEELVSADEVEVLPVLAEVRTVGSPLPPDILESSDLILPHQDSSMDEVRKLLTDEGLIPG